MARTKTGGKAGAKQSSGGGKKAATSKTMTSKTMTSKTADSSVKSGTTVTSTSSAAASSAQTPARPFAAERMQSQRPASRAKDPLQASIERQSQLQLMIRTQNSARAWARNVRQMQVVLLFVWFGFWTFLESFLDIGHRVTHAWGLQSHRSAGHDVLMLDGAMVEGLFSATVGIGIGLAIYKGVQRAVKA